MAACHLDGVNPMITTTVKSCVAVHAGWEKHSTYTLNFIWVLGFYGSNSYLQVIMLMEFRHLRSDVCKSPSIGDVSLAFTVVLGSFCYSYYVA